MPEQNVDNIAFLREAGEALAELKEAPGGSEGQDLADEASGEEPGSGEEGRCR